MEGVREGRRSPATLLMLAALIVACAALAVSLGEQATGTTAEASKIGKVKEYFKSVTVPDGEEFGSAEATCKGKRTAISGGFGFPPESGAYVWSSTKSAKKKWEVTLNNPPGGGEVELTAIVYCAK